jgi:O-antigen ligase
MTHADRFLDLTLRLPGWAIIAASSLLAYALGWAYVNRPALAIGPALLLVSLPLVLSARVRFVAVVFGALLVFQSSEELTNAKLLYLYALGISFGAVLVRLPMLTRTPAFRDLVPMFRGSLILLALVAVSLPVSALNEVPQKDWLRDVAPYVMVACAPFFALDAQASLSDRALRRMLVAGGTIGALGFTAQWLTNRGIADLGFVPVGLPTILLAATVFAYGVSVLLHGNRRRLAWAVLTSLVLAMLLTTGTRTALVLLAAPLAIVFGSRHRLTQRSIKMVAAAPLLALLVFLSAQAVVRVTNADREALAARTSLLFSTGDRDTDQSYLDRLAQTDAGWEAFRSSPLVGTGPGKPIVWESLFEGTQASPSVDSPVSLLAKFGLLGLLAALATIIGYIGTLRAFRARTGVPTVTYFALVGFGAVVAAWALLLNPYEDKGFAIGLMLLLAVGAREASDAALSPGGPTMRNERM